MANAAKEKKILHSPIGIATFTHLFEPHAFPARKGQAARDPVYKVTLVFDKAASRSPEMKAIKTAVEALAVEKFGPKALQSIEKGKIAVPWREASDYEEYGEPFTNAGATMMTFKSNTPPGIVDRNARDIMDRKEIYSGCKMRVSFVLWPYDTDGSLGITTLLNNCQKAGNGPKLAGRTDASEDFDTIDGDDDDDDGDDGDGGI